MKCLICGHEVNNENHRCTRFPICRYIMETNENAMNDDETYVLFDIETTGINKTKDRITEIGAIKVENGNIIDTFSMLVNPGLDENGNQIFISSRITDLTGITNEMVRDADVESDAIKKFVAWLGDVDVLAGQNVIRFDIPFIKMASKRANITLECNKAIDTLVIAKKLKLKERGLVENLQQPTLAKYYGFSYNAHRAIDDVNACYKILNLMKEDGKKNGIAINPEMIKRS